MSRRIDSPDTDADLKLRDLLASVTAPSFVVDAGAGSGKTTSLVKALQYLRDNKGSQLRKHGQRVACITYTDVAAGEIHGEIDQDPLFHVSTIHSFFWHVIKPFKRDVSAWVLQRIDEKILGLEEHNDKPRTRPATREKNLAQIDRLNADKQAVVDVSTFTYGVGSQYAQGVLGHDDIIKMGPALVLERPLLRRLIAQQFPFIFVDESQDTFPQVVAALKAIAADSSFEVSIGFFGDPMQQIYPAGIGRIAVEPGWRKVDKPNNFRCPTAVLTVINNIRSQVPGALVQVGGRHVANGDNFEPVAGSAHLFILPIDERRDQNLAAVRSWLADETADAAWRMDDSESDVRVLVIEHRLAARRLGFETLFSSLHDKSTEELKSGVAEGTAWPTSVFVNYLTPLATAVWKGRKFDQAQLIRMNSSLRGRIMSGASSSGVLKTLSDAAAAHATLMAPGSAATVREVINHAMSTGLWVMDEKLREYEALLAESVEHEAAQPEESQTEAKAVARFLEVPALELVAYQSYLREHSVYATHQGVKGTEYERVLVLLEDDAAAGNSFSYDKLLGLADLSETDRKNVAAGLESTVDRTRRLFYVACSRAERSLAVVIFTSDVAAATHTLKSLGIFDPDSVYEISNISAA